MIEIGFWEKKRIEEKWRNKKCQRSYQFADKYNSIWVMIRWCNQDYEMSLYYGTKVYKV